MRVLLILAVLVGCSLAMKPLKPDYDPRTIPRCETSGGPPVGDALGGVVFTTLTIVVAASDHEAVDGTSNWVPAVGVAVAAAAFIGASVAGFGWDSKCQSAIKQWDKRQIEQDTLVQESKAKPVEVVAAPPPLRGFYCAGAAFCTRDKPECARTREISLKALPDLAECTLTETAWCYGDRCFPREGTCTEQSQRAKALACVEMR